MTARLQRTLGSTNNFLSEHTQLDVSQCNVRWQVSGEYEEQIVKKNRQVTQEQKSTQI